MSPKRVQKEKEKEKEEGDHCRTAIIPCVAHPLTVPSTSMFWRWNVITTESTLSRSWTPSGHWVDIGSDIGQGRGLTDTCKPRKEKGEGVKKEKGGASIRIHFIIKKLCLVINRRAVLFHGKTL